VSPTACANPALSRLLAEVRRCTICEHHLPLGTNPVLSAAVNSRIVLISQAPGVRVHRSGVPWDDESGKRLRSWLDVDDETFYDPTNFAILPMGFCYPGTHPKGGDLPPRKECAPQWHPALFEELPNLRLKVVIGNYAQKYYLGKRAERTLTDTVRNFEAYLPAHFPLVHPSPLNHGWLKKNPWYEADVLPVLKRRVHDLVS